MTTKQYNRNRVPLRLTASLLAFLFVLTPLAPVLAQKVTKSLPVTPLIVSPSKEFKKNNSLSQEEQLAKVREHILNNKLPKTALDRLNVFEATQKKIPKRKSLLTRVSNFITGNIDKAKEKKEAIEFSKREPFKVETFKGKINTAGEETYEKIFKNGKEQVSLTKNTMEFLARIFGSEEAFADASDNPNDYLAEGGEITFSQAIKDQTNTLGKDPLKILNFVRNEVKYVPYYGSKKGSDATLVEFAGNDMDKVSLLIAMFRYSNIPARYRRVDAKISIRTVTDLLGVDSPIAAAKILSLGKIPYTLYTQNGDPIFFVVEHTYVEAYMPYGYSRGIDMSDGGTPQWVPMDPTINAYYYEQLVDIIGGMNNNGFDIKVFFDNYLNGNYNTLEPLDAFKSEVNARLATITPEYYPNMTYEDALTHSYPKKDNLEFIPGSLPFEISADLNTYDYIPASLRHTIKFAVKDGNNNQVLNHTAYVSDLADKELLVTYNAATPSDQTIIDTFDTIYDVVPLSLVAVKPTIKINGAVVATGATSVTLGQLQKYTMEFSIPTRTLGGPVIANIAETLEESTLTGTSNAIAFNTDRVIPPELRPTQDTASGSFMSDQMLYRTAVDYLDRLQYADDELANIIGSDFTHTATGAVISNGIKVTNSNGEPYSFEWKGLRIDSSALVRYFNRFNEDTNRYRGEFVALFTLQASQDESDIFENNFNVQSVATVKGLKLVSSGYFPNTTLKKITSVNESDIDSLAIFSGTKTAFHTAIAEGKTIFTPTKPVTYGQWQGLFYITTNFNDEASYIIGEGLNGGYSVCSMPGVANTLCNWSQGVIDLLLPQAQASGITATISVNPLSVFVGETVSVVIRFTKGTFSWVHNLFFQPTQPGTKTISVGNGANQTTNVVVKKKKLGNKYPGFDDLFYTYGAINDIPPDLLKSMAFQESCCTYSDESKKNILDVFDPKAYRYEAHKDYDWYSGPSATAKNRIESHPERHFAIAGTAIYGSVTGGDQVPPKSEYQLWSFHMSGYKNTGLIISNNDNPTAQQLLDHFQDYYWKKYKGVDENWNFTPQFLLASSYGILQAMYDTALTRMVVAGLEIKRQVNDPNEHAQDAVPIENLYDAEFSIKIGSGYLKKQYNENGHDWKTALRLYNGAESYATAVINNWNNGNGIFKEIIE